jgi:hypothetical protein
VEPDGVEKGLARSSGEAQVFEVLLREKEKRLECNFLK